MQNGRITCPKQSWPGASSRINGLQGPKSSTNIQYIGKENEEAKKLRSRTYWREVIPDHNPTTYQHAQAGSQEKEKENISETQSSMTFHKGKVFTKSTSPLTSSWAKYK
jgi:ATP-dependent helicase YprA (DUF1998 family)